MNRHHTIITRIGFIIAFILSIALMPRPALAQSGTNTLAICTQQYPSPNAVRTKTFRWWSGLGGYFDHYVDTSGNPVCTVISETLSTGSWNFSQTIYSGWTVLGDLVVCAGNVSGSYTWTQSTRNLNVTFTSNLGGTVYCYTHVDDLLN